MYFSVQDSFQALFRTSTKTHVSRILLSYLNICFYHGLLTKTDTYHLYSLRTTSSKNYSMLNVFFCKLYSMLNVFQINKNNYT